jgi:hypothetical protein
VDYRRQLIDQIKARALVYLEVYDTLAESLGAARAEELLAASIYRRGCQVGCKFERYAPADFAGLRDAFIKGIPGEGELFAPEVRRCDAQGLEIRFHACPLKDAWVEAGLPQEKIALLCRIAGRVDNGTFESAGFAIDATTWAPGAGGCCTLRITPRQRYV